MPTKPTCTGHHGTVAGGHDGGGCGQEWMVGWATKCYQHSFLQLRCFARGRSSEKNKMFSFYQKCSYLVKNDCISVHPSPRKRVYFVQGGPVPWWLITTLLPPAPCPRQSTRHAVPSPGPPGGDFRRAWPDTSLGSLEEPQHLHKAWLRGHGLKPAWREERRTKLLVVPSRNRLGFYFPSPVQWFQCNSSS